MNRLLKNIAIPVFDLGLMRKGISLLCILDLAQRLTQARFLLSDLGAFPRYSLYSFGGQPYTWSAYLISGQPVFVTTLLLATVCLASLSLLNRSRRISRAFLWFLMLSVQARNPGICDAADDLLRLLLFWDIFLPDDGEKNVPLVSLATFGLQCQLSLALVFTSLSHYSQSSLLSSASWGVYPWATVFPWFGKVETIVLGLTVGGIWLWPVRRYLLVPLGLVLVTRAVLLDPVFPATVAAGLAYFFSSRPSEGLRLGHCLGMLSGTGSAKWLSYGAVCSTLCLTLVAFSQCLRGGSPKFEAMAQGLGVQQNWTRVYPLSQERLRSLSVRTVPRGDAVFSITLDQGRRSRLLAEALLQDPRRLQLLSTSLGRLEKIDGRLEIWFRSQRIRPDLAAEAPQVRLISSAVVNSQHKYPENPK